jgi:hypothetical protein
MGAAQISFLFGNPGDKPVAGDWDGDGIDEVGLHRESTGFFPNDTFTRDAAAFPTAFWSTDPISQFSEAASMCLPR